MGEVVAGVELWEDFTLRGEQPVVEHPHHVLRVGPRFDILDDEHPEQPPLDLLAGSHVGMEPKRPSILRGELVDERLARLDGRLRHARHPVHGVRHAHPVPVDRRGLRKPVGQRCSDGLAKPNTALPRDASIETIVLMTAFPVSRAQAV